MDGMADRRYFTQPTQTCHRADSAFIGMSAESIHGQNSGLAA